MSGITFIILTQTLIFYLILMRLHIEGESMVRITQLHGFMNIVVEDLSILG